jgi:hypothetical protein
VYAGKRFFLWPEGSDGDDEPNQSANHNFAGGSEELAEASSKTQVIRASNWPTSGQFQSPGA